MPIETNKVMSVHSIDMDKLFTSVDVPVIGIVPDPNSTIAPYRQHFKERIRGAKNTENLKAILIELVDFM